MGRMGNPNDHISRLCKSQMLRRSRFTLQGSIYSTKQNNQEFIKTKVVAQAGLKTTSEMVTGPTSSSGAPEMSPKGLSQVFAGHWMKGCCRSCRGSRFQWRHVVFADYCVMCVSRRLLCRWWGLFDFLLFVALRPVVRKVNINLMVLQCHHKVSQRGPAESKLCRVIYYRPMSLFGCLRFQETASWHLKRK